MHAEIIETLNDGKEEYILKVYNDDNVMIEIKNFSDWYEMNRFLYEIDWSFFVDLNKEVVTKDYQWPTGYSDKVTIDGWENT